MAKKTMNVMERAIATVPGFKDGWEQLKQRIVLDGKSSSLLSNYGRYVAYTALHFNKSPELITISEMEKYLYKLKVEDKYSETFFKFTVYGMRYWYRLFGLEDTAIEMPSIKKKDTLPEVLSKREVKRLISSADSFKHKFILAFVYSTGMRLGEARFLKLSDISVDRMQIHIRQGKGSKDRYVILSKYIANRLPAYLEKYRPKIYLFEGTDEGFPMKPRSMQYVMQQARERAKLNKVPTMHTLRHSYATHLLEDGVDLYSIHALLGHAQLRTTIIYLHIAQVLPKVAHSPLDSLYGFLDNK